MIDEFRIWNLLRVSFLDNRKIKDRQKNKQRNSVLDGIEESVECKTVFHER